MAVETKLLATTALEETWGPGGPLVFLGEWCRLYDRRSAWTDRPHQVVRNHWDDREKLSRDHAYLKSLHDALLSALASALNRIHRIERSARYWQTILDPWLLTYVSVVWDRWECLRTALEDHGAFDTVSLEPAPKHRPFFDYNDFIQRMQDDSWNYRIFLEIIAAEHAGHCRIVQLQSRGDAATDGGTPRAASVRDIKSAVKAALDSLLGLIPLRPRAMFIEPSFPPAALLRLNLRLGQIPRLHLKEFKWPTHLDGERGPDRKDFAFSLKPKDRFEAFLFRRLARELPVVFLEKRPALLATAGRITMKPRVILSATALWINDLFKLWCAERVHEGTKLISMAHGGCFPLLFDTMSFEEEIADIKTVWVAPYHRKQVRLPSNKIVTKRYRSTRETIAVVGLEMPRYHYRAISTPHGGQVLSNFEQVREFYSRLDEKVQRSFLVKPYPDRGWNTRQRFIDTLGASRVSDEKNYERFLSSARVIVCTYPETTFLEAMASGLPSILLYPKRLWETIAMMEPLLDTLRAAKIVFHDPSAAAAHINSIWENPESWWASPAVLRARNEFNRVALDLSGNWLERWASFIETQIREDAA